MLDNALTLDKDSDIINNNLLNINIIYFISIKVNFSDELHYLFFTNIKDLIIGINYILYWMTYDNFITKVYIYHRCNKLNNNFISQIYF